MGHHDALRITEHDGRGNCPPTYPPKRHGFRRDGGQLAVGTLNRREHLYLTRNLPPVRVLTDLN
jgi:hypothetical protein